MASVLNLITVSDLKSWSQIRNDDLIKIYKDSIVVACKVHTLSIFQNPCRIDGVVIFLCTKGQIECSIDLKKYHLGPGSLLVNFTSGITQVDKLTDMEGYAMLVSTQLLNHLHIDFSKRQSVYMTTRKDAIISLNPQDTDAIAKLFELTEFAFSFPSTDQDDLVHGLLQSLAHIVVQILTASDDKVNAMPQQQPARAEQLFEHFVTLVSQNHCEERGVQFYADKMCLTPNYLSSVVRKVSGKSATDWINDFVISEAKILLRYLDVSVQEVAYKLNFPTQSAFGKYFKQCTGLSPRAFRKTLG